ncbi:MAG: hypothetical protein AABW92_03340 [Nanoarchaeota archaeon]
MKLSQYYRPEIARIVAELISDGHMQDDSRYLISFYSKYIDVIKSFEARMLTNFKVNSWIFQDKRSPRFKLFIKSRETLKLLKKLGVPSGNKTNQKFPVPKWILKGDRKIKSNFLSGIFDSEGYIYFTKINENHVRWRIGLEFYKNKKLVNSCIEFMEQIRDILVDFDISSSPTRFKKGNIRKDGSESIGVRFEIEKKGFNNFYKHINFHIDSKRGKLLKALES